MLFRFRLQPDRVEVPQKEIERIWLRDDPARYGQDDAVVGRRDAFDGLALEPPVAFLAVERHQFVDRHARRGFDLGVELHERDVARRRREPTKRRLAGPAQADQRDPAPALFAGIVRIEERQDAPLLLDGRGAEKGCHP